MWAWGLVIFQLLAALFAAIWEIPISVSVYSGQRILLTIAISAGLFLLSSLASLRYLKKVTVSELLKEEAAERSEKLRRGMKNDGRESVFS